MQKHSSGLLHIYQQHKMQLSRQEALLGQGYPLTLSDSEELGWAIPSSRCRTASFSLEVAEI